MLTVALCYIGMDNFKDVYRSYYDEEEINEAARNEFGLFNLDPGTIEVIGVFDTVGSVPLHC